MNSVPFVALGGAIGASLRYLVALAVLRLSPVNFPLATMGVNVVGSFVMGMCAVYLASRGLGHWAPFLMTGVLGGFTTFSAFSLEAYTLFERGEVAAAGTYVVLSVVLSIMGLIAGMALARGYLI